MDMILEHWLSAGAGVFLIGMVLYGHYRGALKQCVSLGALILTIVLVKIATPYMTDFIKDNPSGRGHTGCSWLGGTIRGKHGASGSAAHCH